MRALGKVGFPCYVKPADNSASRGIIRLAGKQTDREQLYQTFTQGLKACCLRKEVLVEAEMPGREYSVDTVLYQSRLYPAGISDCVFLKKYNYAVQSGSMTPSLLPERTQQKMYEIMEQAACVLGVTDGAFKGDLVIDSRGNVGIIEVAARTSGGFDSQYRKPLSFGIDIIKATMDIACGYPFDARDLVPRWVKWSSTTTVFPESGRVTSIRGIDRLKKLKGVHEVIMLCKAGDIIPPYVNCATRTNFIISSADTIEELRELEKKIRKTLIIKTTSL